MSGETFDVYMNDETVVFKQIVSSKLKKLNFNSVELLKETKKSK